MSDTGKKIIISGVIITGGVIIMRLLQQKQEEERIKKYLEELQKRKAEKREVKDEINYDLLWSKIGEKASKVANELIKQGKTPYAKMLYDELNNVKTLDVKQKCWIYLQARHETAGFTQFAGDFNYWGIKFPKKKDTRKEFEKLGIRPKKRMTFEITPEGKVNVISEFCSFPNVKVALEIYMNYIIPARKALFEAETLKDFAYLLKYYGYYTDYAENYYNRLRESADLLLA